MPSNLQEIARDFCDLSDQDFTSSKVFAQELFKHLNKIDSVLKKISSRFIDIDPSVKINTNDLENFQEQLELLSDDSVDLDSLLEIYECMALYLLMRERFGEAADWYLKNEYDAHLGQGIQDVMMELEVI